MKHRYSDTVNYILTWTEALTKYIKFYRTKRERETERDRERQRETETETETENERGTRRKK